MKTKHIDREQVPRTSNLFHLYLEAHDNNGVMACTDIESGGHCTKIFGICDK